MSELWEHSARVVCTHPGWSTLRGWGSVAASFFALFQGSGSLQFVLTEEHVEVDGDLAWVSLDENLLGAQAGATVAALNLFRYHPGEGRWQLICHHGSSVVAAGPGPADRMPPRPPGSGGLPPGTPGEPGRRPPGTGPPGPHPSGSGPA